MIHKNKYVLPILLVVQIVVVQIISCFPIAVESFYSNGFYKKTSLFLRFFFQKIPFSVGDSLYFVILFFVLKWFWKIKYSWKTEAKNHIITILSFFSIFYFCFHLMWGLNYYRQPLFEKMAIQKDYSIQDLTFFTQKLIQKTNSVQFEITKNKSQKIKFPYTQNQVFEMNLNGFSNLSKDYKYFSYYNLCVKKSLFSVPLAYMGFAGYLNPFSNEAQINYLMPNYNLPTTTCHEMAHQIGFASESECNFIGFLASTKNNNLYFQYSGYSFALRYCMATLKKQDEKLAQTLLLKINHGVLENYKESDLFWSQYETPIEQGFAFFYDHFLKINQQNDGLEGYSKFVNLMVNFYKTNQLS